MQAKASNLLHKNCSFHQFAKFSPSKVSRYTVYALLGVWPMLNTQTPFTAGTCYVSYNNEVYIFLGICHQYSFITIPDDLYYTI